MENRIDEQKKILVLVDGSERSLNTIRYVAEFAPFKGMQVVLFNVFHKIPDYYWDLTNEPMMAGRGGYMASWEHQNKGIIDRFMEKSVAMLRTSGFKQDDIKIRIDNLKKGVTRDIIAEAGNGYAAVIARRRGFTRVPGILMGSVADKLMVSLDFVPLFFAGVEPASEKILIAMDNSESAMEAVKFVAKIGGKSDCFVTLFHVVREGDIFADDLYGVNSEGRSIMMKVFEASRNYLSEGGFKLENINNKVITGTGSRAGTIAMFAAEGGYSTIVMGRKGVSSVKEFFLGRVSKKVIYAAHNRTVCIV